MSVLRDRIIQHGGEGRGTRLAVGNLPTTPMTMPMAHVTYGSDDLALYGTLHPLVTADGAVVPAYSEAQIVDPYPARVVPAGQP